MLDRMKHDNVINHDRSDERRWVKRNEDDSNLIPWEQDIVIYNEVSRRHIIFFMFHVSFIIFHMDLNLGFHFESNIIILKLQK